jgi:deoxyhypusine synthase
MEKEIIARENILKKAEEVEGIKIKGWDFNNGKDYNKIFSNLEGCGFQASHLAKAINIINKMIENKATIFLGYTSNMVSSGNRDIIRWLAEHKKVNVMVTTAGGIEEDIMKCMGDFFLGDFRACGTNLRKKGINRIGNIFVSNNRYIEFEDFTKKILKELYDEQKQTGKIFTPTELIWKMGEKINNKKSICYWAWKNKIKIFCPAIGDGAVGDDIYFFKSRNPDFLLDISSDIKELNDSTIALDKSGVILLGAGVIKHAILNANLFRNGADYAVYINTAMEFDGSDAGSLPEEAVSWGKLLPTCERIKVHGDATILLPIIVGETFFKNK